MNPGQDPALMQWRCVPFEGLSANDVYDLLQLRSAVFVLEQNCVFQDIDGADRQALHVLGHVDGALQAYARCFAAGVKFPEASIGRVVIGPSLRATGAGHLLMQQAMAALAQQWGAQSVRIGAQARLERFYAVHGFVVASAPYLEDNIAHIEMLRPA